MTEQPMRRTQARLAERERQRKKTERKQMLLKFVPLGLVAIFIVVGVGTLIYNNIQATGDIAGHQGPRLSLDRDQIDFGDLKLDNTVRASFKVANVGDGTLHLTVPNVATVVEGCWPGDVVVGQTTLQPGQSTTLYTDFMMHEGMAGKHLFEVALTTNDPTQQTKTLQIKSNWVP